MKFLVEQNKPFLPFIHTIVLIVLFCMSIQMMTFEQIFHSLATRAVWPDGLIVFLFLGHLQRSKFTQEQKYFAKVGPKYCQVLIKAFKIIKHFWNFAKVAKIHQIWSHLTRGT